MNNPPCRKHMHDGFNTFREAACSIYGEDDCQCIAEKATKGKSSEELVEFVAGMLLGLACIKQKIVNTRLFGSPDAEF